MPNWILNIDTLGGIKIESIFFRLKFPPTPNYEMPFRSFLTLWMEYSRVRST